MVGGQFSQRAASRQGSGLRGGAGGCGFFRNPKGSLQAWTDTVGGGGEPKEREEGPECRPTHFGVALDRPFPTLKCVLECGSGRLGQC